MQKESGVIWSGLLDNKWECKVKWIGGDSDKAKLTCSDGEQTIVDMEVSVAYGAIWGPDVGDVRVWQDKCVEAVDKINA